MLDWDHRIPMGLPESSRLILLYRRFVRNELVRNSAQVPGRNRTQTCSNERASTLSHSDQCLRFIFSTRGSSFELSKRSKRKTWCAQPGLSLVLQNDCTRQLLKELFKPIHTAKPSQLFPEHVFGTPSPEIIEAHLVAGTFYPDHRYQRLPSRQRWLILRSPPQLGLLIGHHRYNKSSHKSSFQNTQEMYGFRFRSINSEIHPELNCSCESL